MEQTTHTLWRQGELLDTNVTRKWSEDHRRSANTEERCRVFERFSNDDQGRSRELVCVCYGQDAEARAEFIVLACNTHQDLVDALKLSEAFVSAIVDMTEGKGAICETSVSAPGVTIRRHARQVLPKILKALAKIQK